MWSTIKRDFQRGTMVNKLIIVNVIVFLVFNVLLQFILLILRGTPGGESAFTEVLQLLSVPGNPPSLALKFWAPITYMFLHDGIFHILSNMLLFYWFGIIFRDICGERRILPIYLLGGLGGAVFYIIYSIFAPSASYLLGASASVTAIIVVAAATAPYYSVFIPLIGPVRIMWLALFVVSFFFLRVFYANTGGEIAHFGGLTFGLLYVWLYQRGIDLAEKINQLSRNISDFFTRLRNPSARHMKKASKQQRTRQTQYAKARTGAGNNYQNQPPHRSHDDREEQIRQDRIDSILEKIKQSGYTSLTEDEKDYLFRASKE